MGHRTSAWRGTLAVLLLLALATRALVPSGWMPMAGPAGVRLMLCPAQGPMPGHHHGRDDHQAADHPCAFAGLGLPAAPPPPPLPNLLPPSAAEAPRFVADLAARPGRGLAAPPPPATGPPFPA